jgi:poly(hydroxyalkanoate) depolymerase family esterase
MTGLGETTAMLARMRRDLRQPTPSKSMIARTFQPNPGRLTLLHYKPPGLAPGAPLVVVLHGCTQTAEAFAVGSGWLQLADALGFQVAAPEQTPQNNPNRCFNWFTPAAVAREGGEAASIAAMVGAVVREHQADPARVFIVGLSAGGAMTAAMLIRYPQLFAGGAVIGGLPFGAAHNVQEALGAMARGGQGALPVDLSDLDLAPLSIWHGAADSVVHPANADALARQWCGSLQRAQAPDLKVTTSFGTRATWHADDGRVLVELNLVRGMGHGTPLSTRGENGIGTPGPYMLETGVSSSLEILRFWGLGAPGACLAKTAPVDTARDRVASNAAVVEHRADGDHSTRVGAEVMKALGALPASVQDTIAKALRSAGLLK